MKNNFIKKYINLINYPYNGYIDQFINYVYSSKEVPKSIKLKRWENWIRYILAISLLSLYTYFSITDNDIALLILTSCMLLVLLLISIYNGLYIQHEQKNYKRDIAFVTKTLEEFNFLSTSRIEGLKFCLMDKLRRIQALSTLISTIILSALVLIIQSYFNYLDTTKVITLIIACAAAVLFFRFTVPSKEEFQIIKILDLINKMQLQI